MLDSYSVAIKYLSKIILDSITDKNHVNPFMLINP